MNEQLKEERVYKNKIEDFIGDKCLGNKKNRLIKIKPNKLKPYLYNIADTHKVDTSASSTEFCINLLNKYESLTKNRLDSLGKTIFGTLLKEESECRSAKTIISLINRFFLYFGKKFEEKELEELFDFCVYKIKKSVNTKNLQDVTEKFDLFNQGYLVEESLAQNFATKYNCEYEKAKSGAKIKWVTVYNR